ncbi:restriction endonuclease subunit S [Comamonas sp.]|uniref:restriction endonuclease subunit S n=1 Tax=Comamonas sp. TaxID=34028 RepID=UPI0026496E10|nr:restriction endonuclease subunit S [Comamonas sp.]MDN5536944.1 restriction endonuclease subunit S [Comamonas sp.]
MSVQVPKGYKQTEVGVIPEDWKVTLVEELGKFSKGRGIRKDEASTGDIPCVRYGEIYTHHHDYIRQFNSRISKSVALTSTPIKQGDILFAGSGETKAEIGKCVAFINNIEAYAGGDILIFSPKKDYSIFLGYLLNSPVVTKQKASKGQGDAVVHISASALASVKIPLPDIAEQQAIAEALSDADTLIESLEQLIAKKRQIKQGAMQELLTGQRRLPGFSGEWEVKSLEVIADIDPEQLNSKTFPDYEFKYISLEDVDFGSLVSHSLQIFSSAPSRARRKLKKNDILVSTVRPNLKSHLWFKNDGADWICSTGFSVIRCHEGVANPGYVFSHLFAENVNKQIDALLTGSNYPAINSRDVRQLEIPLPELDEQVAISCILNDLELEVVALESRLDKARQIKQAMMQELLTGRIRLI